MEYRFRDLAAVTAVLTGVLMLLGVFTAAEGAGLTCAQRWPLCDGPLGGLLPANYLSGVEWFHRVVAGATGLVVLGQTVQAWRTGQSKPVRYASTLALVVLPVQVVLGMLTVTTYEWLVLVAHFTTATLIFGALVYAAAWAYKGAMETTAVRARNAALVAAGLTPITTVFSPRLLFAYGSAVQVTYYLFALALFGTLVAATVWLRAERTKAVTGLAALVVGGLLVLGRQNYGQTVAFGTVAALVVVLACALLASQWAKAEIAVKRTTGIFSDS
ncbi:COX15/CtaA family protein [Halorarius litoreus]|uniref:COX15/CtaA family protein n=1 Tax=Halorarius litoreus TaxID=2962676 RepID=UPI0020CEAF5E|nr:COX15/CtaA family protein [Halorarius litoreus]